VTCKVGFEAGHVYFYAETKEPLTTQTGNNWMLLSSTPTETTHRVVRLRFILSTRRSWTKRPPPNALTRPMRRKVPESERQQLDYRCAGNKLRWPVPGAVLPHREDGVTFDFHWCDNPADLKEPDLAAASKAKRPNRHSTTRCILEKLRACE